MLQEDTEFGRAPARAVKVRSQEFVDDTLPKCALRSHYSSSGLLKLGWTVLDPAAVNLHPVPSTR